MPSDQWFPRRTFLLGAVLFGTALFTFAAGCNEPPADSAAAGGAAPGAPVTGAGGEATFGGAGPTTPSPQPTAGTTVTEETCAPVADPGPAVLRSLTRAEYVKSVAALTGVDPEASGLLPQPDRQITTFQRTSENFSLETRAVRGYLDVAEAAATKMFETPESRSKYLGCEPTLADGAACLSQFAARFGRQAFRRPLDATETANLVALAQSAAVDVNPYAGAALIVEALLQSPSFLMHVEVGRPEAPGLRRALTGFERASRLSYLLLGTTPNEQLLAAAESGMLDDPAQVEQLALTLLEDEGARASLRPFFQQWLGISSLKDAAVNVQQYPLWSDSLRASMTEETTRLVEDFAWTPGRSFADLLTAKHSYIDSNLAKLYGMTPPAADFAQVSLEGTKRFGLLTQASWLTVMSGGAVTPIRRGKFIRSSLLCAPPIPLPPNVPELEPTKPGQSEREVLEHHRSSPACAGCHEYLDPLGFGLARYDGIGAYREVDAQGLTIDESGEFAYDSNPNVRLVPAEAFVGPGELSQLLTQTSAFQACVVEKLFEYALARPEPNRCISQPVKRAFADSGYAFRSALGALVRADAFLYRRDPLQEVAQP
ncbi:MAG: hypothetical protein RJA70_314 [Pseudomonadota bacterium]|jgi:hypothetical protein